MAQPTTTFLDELTSAARGCVALLVGNRQAPSYFDFSQRGLIGSIIALIVGLAVQAFGPGPIQTPGATDISTSAFMIIGSILMAVQIAVAYGILRLLGRADGFVPFVVVHNWGSLFQGVLSVTLTLTFGPPIVVDTATQLPQLGGGGLPLLVLSIATMVVWVNIARLVLTLRPAHVIAFIVAQVAALFIIALF